MCYSQSSLSGDVIFKVISSKSINPVLNDSTVITKQKTEYLERLSEQFKNLEYSLKFSKNESFYELKKTMKNDGSSPYYSKYAEIIVGNHKIHVDIDSKIVLKQKELHGKTFLINDSLTKEWKIFRESKMINGYNCYKAEKVVDNNKVVAWFTNDIPVPFGPDLYVGLPGLVLRLETPHVVFYAHKITFYDKERNIKKLTKGLKMTKAEYDKYLKDKIEKDGFKRKALERIKKS